MKLLITGSKKRGIAKALHERLPRAYETEFISRQTGFNLLTEQGRERAVEKSISCDVFINNAKLDNFCQTLLLKSVYDHWIKTEKHGHIINIGSTADTGLKGGSRLYPVEKTALKNLSRKLSLDAQSGNGIKITYISFGYLDTEGVSFADKLKIDLDHVIDIILFAIEVPDYININEISADPIQKGD